MSEGAAGGLRVFNAEYSRKLLEVAALEAGMPVELRGDEYLKLGQALAAKQILLVQVKDPVTMYRVQKVIEGKDAGTLLNVSK